MTIQQEENGQLTYTFTANGAQLVDKSPMGFTTEAEGTIPDSSWTVARSQNARYVMNGGLCGANARLCPTISMN